MRIGVLDGSVQYLIVWLKKSISCVDNKLKRKNVMKKIIALLLVLFVSGIVFANPFAGALEYYGYASSGGISKRLVVKIEGQNVMAVRAMLASTDEDKKLIVAMLSTALVNSNKVQIWVDTNGEIGNIDILK
jgi:hypothetical protein